MKNYHDKNTDSSAKNGFAKLVILVVVQKRQKINLNLISLVV